MVFSGGARGTAPRARGKTKGNVGDGKKIPVDYSRNPKLSTTFPPHSHPPTSATVGSTTYLNIIVDLNDNLITPSSKLGNVLDGLRTLITDGLHFHQKHIVVLQHSL